MNPDKEELVKYKINKAGETLTQIEILVDTQLWNVAINRLYYACFYAVTALLAQYDIEAKTHTGTQNQFHLNFVKTEIISREMGKFYSEIFRMRQKNDYEDFVEYGKDDVLALIPLSTEFVSQIKSILSQ